MAQQRRVGTVATTVTGRSAHNLRVTYHQTDVVTVTNGVIRLDSGGWRTNTTKTRMNQAANQYGLHFQVYQTKHTWYVRAWNDSDYDNGLEQLFTDGMQVKFPNG